MQTSLLDYYSEARHYKLKKSTEQNKNNVNSEKSSENQIQLYFREIMKKYGEKNLFEKYAISINIIMNKDIITEDKDFLQEICKSLIDWLLIEKRTLEKTLLELNNNLNIYININVFIGLLINIINLLELSNITIKYLIKNQFIQNLFVLYNFLKCYLIPNFIIVNPSYEKISLQFLIKKIEKILSKWKKQKECFELSQKILDFFGKKKTSLLGKKKLRDNSSEEDLANSSTESVENDARDKNNKRVKFEINQNAIYYYNQNDKIASY